jgi:hypothetical protein
VGNATLATDVTADPSQNSVAQVAVDAQGNAVAIWDVLERGLYFVSASLFE